MEQVHIECDGYDKNALGSPVIIFTPEESVRFNFATKKMTRVSARNVRRSLAFLRIEMQGIVTDKENLPMRLTLPTCPPRNRNAWRRFLAILGCVAYAKGMTNAIPRRESSCERTEVSGRI